MDKHITIKIDPVGRPTIEAHGFTGSSCKDATKAIEEAFAGGGGVETVDKPEMHMVDEQQNDEQLYN